MNDKQLKQFPLVKLSVCGCGYGVLDDAIQLGTKYTVDLGSFNFGYYRCGRCHKAQTIQIVLATQQLNPDRPMAYLPAGLFDLSIERISPSVRGFQERTRRTKGMK